MINIEWAVEKEDLEFQSIVKIAQVNFTQGTKFS